MFSSHKAAKQVHLSRCYVYRASDSANLTYFFSVNTQHSPVSILHSIFYISLHPLQRSHVNCCVYLSQINKYLFFPVISTAPGHLQVRAISSSTHFGDTCMGPEQARTRSRSRQRMQQVTLGDQKEETDL